jgi:hypothetical protein
MVGLEKFGLMIILIAKREFSEKLIAHGSHLTAASPNGLFG